MFGASQAYNRHLIRSAVRPRCVYEEVPKTRREKKLEVRRFLPDGTSVIDTLKYQTVTLRLAPNCTRFLDRQRKKELRAERRAKQAQAQGRMH